jgi:hypothetical protein
MESTVGRYPQRNREKTIKRNQKKTTHQNGNQEDNQGIGEKRERSLVE